MPAKSFLSNMREHLQHFSATTLHHEVSDANIRGYLRAASQIAEIWQEIDDQLTALLAQGTAPWEAYTRLGYPLAFIRAARASQVFVKALLLTFRLNSYEARREAASPDFPENGFSPLYRLFRAKLV